MQTAASLLTRTPHRDVPSLSLLGGGIALVEGRLHEACGPARWSFAAWLIGAMQAARSGPVMWMHPAWQGEHVMPDGLSGFCAPEKLLFVALPKMEDILWAMEEALRAGCVPLVVAEVTELPTLTQVRRLHLACEQGAGNFGAAPMALMLTPGAQGGAPGVESRWHITRSHNAQSQGWTLTRLRARTAPEAQFAVGLGPNGPVCGPALKDPA